MASNKFVSSATGAASLSPTVARLLNEGSRALAMQQPDQAERALTAALALAPDIVDAYRMLGIACQMRGDPATAIRYLDKALLLAPDSAALHTIRGTALYERGAVNEALVALRRACALAPDMAASWYNLGKALKMQIHLEEARSMLEQALKIEPRHTQARIALADTQATLGDIDAAVMHYREVLRNDPVEPNAWFALANLKTVKFDRTDLAMLEGAWRQNVPFVDARILIGFSLAKAYEDHGEFAKAYATLTTANALKRDQVRWDAEAEHRRVDEIIAAFSSPHSRPLDESLGQEVVFIVSLPRSGSTLVEQILASHPDVEGANEITDFPQVIEDESRRRGRPFPEWVGAATPEDWFRLGKDYLARTARWRQYRPRFTDKNLVTWQLVGAIRAMLPAARIVSCYRDPVENCFACYRQLFSNGAYFSYDLVDMVRHYSDFRRLQDYWKTQSPAHFLDFPFEDLLAAPEPTIRMLLEFCGLGFDPACLAPHLTERAVRSTASAAQVRQPLRAGQTYVSRYGSLLDPLLARLGSDAIG